MRGSIKFVDRKTAQWGFIVPEDGGPEVHFVMSAFVGPQPTERDIGGMVEFEVTEDSRGRRHASSLHILAPKLGAPIRAAGATTTRLRDWAFLPPGTYTNRDGDDVASILHHLAGLALKEGWHFGEEPDSQQPYPILDNYLKYTFVKLRRESKVFEKQVGTSAWATFNTGLVDRLYDPIFALFEKNRAGAAPWRFFDFCVPGKRTSGRKLTEVFDPLPEPARYFTSNFEMLLDTTKDIHVDYEHVILDGARRNRFPPQFLREHVPDKFEWQDIVSLPVFERSEYLERLSAAIEDDARCMRAIKRRLEDAKLLAEKRIRWNFKTAIPQYYPRLDSMSLLLPLALINDELVDIALVVTRNPSGSYQGRTILPLDWAYKNARLVCRPDSDWLLPNQVLLRGGEDEDDDDPDQVPTTQY